MKVIITEGQYKKIISEQENDCTSKLKPIVSQAVEWWKAWLNHPTTEKKWNNLYGGKTNYKEHLPQWISVLDQIKIIPFDYTTKKLYGSNKRRLPNFNYNTNQTTFAFVVPTFSMTDVFFNCDIEATLKDNLNTLIHELQHLLNYKYPINNLVQFAKKYKVQNTSKQYMVDSEETLIKKIGNEKTESLKRLFGDKFLSIYNKAIDALMNIKDKEYICSPKEKLSNLFTIRHLLNIDPDQAITLELLKPYLSGEIVNDDVLWLFLCWFKIGLPPIEEFLNDLNSLAVDSRKVSNIA